MVTTQRSSQYVGGMSEATGGGSTLALLESILDRVPSAVVVKDRDGVIRYANATYAHLHGLSVDDVVGATEWEFISAESAEQFHLDDLAVIDGNHGVQFDDELPTSAGMRYFKTAKFPLYDDDGTAWAMCAIATEVTAERQLERALRGSRDQLRNLAEWSPGMVYQFRHRADGGYDLPYSSRGNREVFEVEPEEVLSNADPLFNRVHPEDVDAFRRSIAVSEQGCTPWQHEFRVVLPKAGLRWLRASSVPERVGEATIWHGYAEDITSRKMSEQEVWLRANYDSLTGLPNRDLAFDRLEQSIRICRRNRTGLAVLFGDLDGFKDVNDTYGHAMGDRVLAAVGARLPACLRESDTVARLGGDEFLVVLPAAENPAAVVRVCDALTAAVEAPFTIEGTTLRLNSMSIGASFFPVDGGDAATLVAIADARMYRVKHPAARA